MAFPLRFIPRQSYRSGGLRFGAERTNQSGGRRLHAGCDLIARAGTEVLAVDSGIVIEGIHRFYKDRRGHQTYALVVRHPGYVIRYGEIGARLAPGVRVGSTVAAGQVIAYVGEQDAPTMLHLELYRGTAAGNLSQPSNRVYDYVPLPPPGASYERRRDLLDPTSLLDLQAGQMRLGINLLATGIGEATPGLAP